MDPDDVQPESNQPVAEAVAALVACGPQVDIPTDADLKSKAESLPEVFQHGPFCNFWQGPIGGPGCICKPVPAESRVAFEKWAQSKASLVASDLARDLDGNYIDPDADWSYHGWQAREPQIAALKAQIASLTLSRQELNEYRAARRVRAALARRDQEGGPIGTSVQNEESS